MTIKQLTRREALKRMGLAAAGTFILGHLPWHARAQKKDEPSRVVLIRDKNLLNDRRSLIKNYIMFHPRPWDYHPDTCADLAKVWDKPMAKGKTRLNILVMITPLFHGVGPHHFNEKYTWRYNGLIVSFDPVAADATGLRIIEARRKEFFGEERPVSPSPHHIRLADTRHHLGHADPRNIELIRLGWKEGILI